MKYGIGDFSRISRLSIKTLRYYHEWGLLAPTEIDGQTGYRYYDESCLDRVRIITELKDLDFSIKDIKEILDSCTDDSEIVHYISKKSEEINEKIKKYQYIQDRMNLFFNRQQETKALNMDSSIVKKEISDMLIASIRFKGKYEDIGKAYGKLFKYCSWSVSGAPFSMYYEKDFKEDDADIEACLPVKREVNKDDVKSRIIKGGSALTLIHKGPYETIGTSYKSILDYINQNKAETQLPSREVYLKGPGAILPGSPKKYITEIQIIAI